MSNFKKAFLFLIFLGLLLPLAVAQDKARSSVVLEYFEDSSQLVLKDVDGFVINNVYFGMQLLAGETIETKASTAELRLNPNGSIIKIAAKTKFRITSLPGSNSDVHAFSILEGKIRAVAAKASANAYRFDTPTASGGVRGTDFGIEVVPGSVDKLIVKEGLVDFTNTATGNKVSVAAGQFADALASTFATQQASTKDIADFFSPLEFVNLDPTKVSGHGTQIADAPAGSTPPATGSGPVVPASGSGESPASPGVDAAAASPPPAAPSMEDTVLQAIKKFLGLEIGAITIDGATYGKLVLQPKIDTPDFKMGFYLPIIYTNDILNPSDWYHPQGNDEWSFGTDQGTDVLPIVMDAIDDVILKIKYMQIFHRGSPFFLGLGSMPSMTLGHGMLIGDYANDTDFPSVRRSGLSIGFDAGVFGMEALTNNLANPEIIGTRMVLRPAAPSFNLGIGLSVAMDLNPLASFPATIGDATLAAEVANAKTIDPKIFTVSADLDLPVFQNDVFSLLVYADVGGLVPYLTNPLTRTDNSSIPAGLYIENLFYLNPTTVVDLHNYGIMAGIMGKIFVVDYRLEFQSFNGSFEANYFDKTYDRNRGQKALDLITLLKNPNTDVYANQKLGIFGSAGVNILDIVKLSASYKWPWTVGNGSQFDFLNQTNPDEFSVSLDLNEEMIPFNIDFGFKFQRSYFKELFLANTTYSFLDTYATFSGNVDIPIGSFFKIRATLGTSLLRDAQGNIDYSNGAPQVRPTFTLETVF